MPNDKSSELHELRRCVLGHLGRRVGKTMTQLRCDVEDDYGPISERKLYRHLDFLLRNGCAQRRRDPDLQWETIDTTTTYPVYFYLRVRDRLPRPRRAFCRICGLTRTRTSSHPLHLRAARTRGYEAPTYVSVKLVVRKKTGSPAKPAKPKKRKLKRRIARRRRKR